MLVWSNAFVVFHRLSYSQTYIKRWPNPMDTSAFRFNWLRHGNRFLAFGYDKRECKIHCLVAFVNGSDGFHDMMLPNEMTLTLFGQDKSKKVSFINSSTTHYVNVVSNLLCHRKVEFYVNLITVCIDWFSFLIESIPLNLYEILNGNFPIYRSLTAIEWIWVCVNGWLCLCIAHVWKVEISKQVLMIMTTIWWCNV
jgi:hypothetical protein